MKMDITQSLCIFCCNTFTNAEKPAPVLLNGEENVSSLPRFLILLERHLDIKRCLTKSLKKLEIYNDRRQLDTCALCTKILAAFCEIYHQQEILDLQIQWKLQTLMGIMKNGGRVASRRKNVKELFGGEDKGKYSKFKVIRKEMIRMGSQKISQSLPKVRLENLNIQNEKAAMKSSGSRLKHLNIPLGEKQLQNIGRLQCWIMSFAAVVSLLYPFNNKTKEKNCANEAHRDVQTLYDDLSLEIDDDTRMDLLNVTIENTCTNQLGLCNSVSSRDDYFESNDEISSIVNSDDGGVNTEQNFLVHVYESVTTNDVPQLEPCKTEIGEEEQRCEMDADPVDDPLDVQAPPLTLTLPSEGHKNEAPPNMQTSSANSQILIPVLCAYCTNTYKTRITLRHHMKVKHPEKTAGKKITKTKNNDHILCKLCNKQFVNYKLYFLHTKSYNHRRKMKGQIPKEDNQSVGKQRKDIIEDNTAIDSAISPEQLIPEKLTFNESDECKSIREYDSSKIKDPAKAKVGEDTKTAAGSDDSEGESNDCSSSGSSRGDSLSGSDSDDEEALSFKTAKSEEATHHDNQQQNRKDYYCRIEGCQWRTRNQYIFQNHKKLHECSRYYKCNFCDVVEANAVRISMHEIKSHSEKAPLPTKSTDEYHCPRCPYHRNGRINFINHFAWVHLKIKRDLFRKKCLICHVKVLNNHHIRTAHNTVGMDPKKIFKCQHKDCSVEFINRRLLRRHENEYHKVKSLLLSSGDCSNTKKKSTEDLISSKFCQLFFQSKARRRLIRDLKKSYGCGIENCTKRFKSKAMLEKHLKLHGSFKCQFCDVVKDYAPDLPLHELEHSALSAGKKPSFGFKCPRCAYFSRRSNNDSLISHFLERHLDITDKFYNCSVCKRAFGNNRDLKEHFLSHHNTEGVDPTKIKRCTKCPAYFVSDIQLKRHGSQDCAETENISEQGTSSSAIMKTKHYCTFSGCTEIFKLLEELEAHKKLHGQFKCPRCDFVANYAADLAFHEMKHAKRTVRSRPFKCSRCTYSCSSRASFRRHFIKKHLRLDPMVFKCANCKARYATIVALKNHFQKNHKTKGVDPSKIEKCDLCPAYFLQKVQLLKHKTFQHKKKD